MSGRLAGSQEGILEIDKVLSGLFDGFRLIPGSICRIANQYLSNWGIAVTEENKGWIEARSLDSYEYEWSQSDDSYYRAINIATTKAGIEFNNEGLNDTLANKTALVIEAMLEDDKRREFKILDVGAGNGATTMKVLDVMKIRGLDESIFRRCHFYLLEPSDKALRKALETMRERKAASKVSPIGMTVQDHLDTVSDNSYDLVISNAVFHHMSFPDYLSRVYSMLAEDGVMIVGDWHTTIWSQPAFMLPILKALGAPGDRIRDFETFFGVMKGDYERLLRSLPESERESNYFMLEYERHLAEELRGFSGHSKLYMLEAHESLSDRLRNYERAGFTVDLEELRQHHKAFLDMKRNVNKLKRKELGAVVAMGKIPGKSPLTAALG
jgi:2-polyprenyl-3-methyl-5-hydroxy-6-metoxy-1,4-benzoquinol methylase